MDHSAHANHTGHGAMDAAQAVLNATLTAAATAASEVATTVKEHLHGTGERRTVTVVRHSAGESLRS